MSMTSRGDALPKCGCGGLARGLICGLGNYQIECDKCEIATRQHRGLDAAKAAWTRALSAAPPAEGITLPLQDFSFIFAMAQCCPSPTPDEWALLNKWRPILIALETAARRPAPQAEP